MGPLRCSILFLTLAALGAQTRSYRDPQGRFSAPIPPGWNAASNNGAVTLTTTGARATSPTPSR